VCACVCACSCACARARALASVYMYVLQYLFIHSKYVINVFVFYGLVSKTDSSFFAAPKIDPVISEICSRVLRGSINSTVLRTFKF